MLQRIIAQEYTVTWESEQWNHCTHQGINPTSPRLQLF